MLSNCGSYKILKVAVEGLQTPLYYSLGDLDKNFTLGTEVTINLGNRETSGWAIDILSQERAEQEIKEIFGEKEITLKPILAATNCFQPEQMQLFHWMSKYYGASLYEIIDTAIPQRKDSKRKSKQEKITKPSNELKTTALELNEEQALAFEKIKDLHQKNSFSTLLLYGVTGSGKTEIYLQAIQKVLEENQSALVIVPEIALTPQLLNQFTSRFEVPIALLHSQVKPTERWEYWKKMLSGEIRLAIGARSAVFAPLKNLKLIIVDEEHESSYKQSDGLRYHARDVAIVRAKQENAVVVLGSATPSFETLLNAQKGRYELAKLSKRATTNPLPTIELVDFKKVKKKEMISENITPALFQAMEETLNKKGQIIIFYNKRGFSTYLQCESCSEVITCPNCSVTMTFHKGRNQLLCHFCNQTIAPPTICKHCLNPKTTEIENEAEKDENFGRLAARGAGTEKIVEEINALFPLARIVRLDRDTTSTFESYTRILGAIKNGEADILVGTQMIAKGHDLPGVTLVGIIDADVGLHFPDFRASERTFQLLTQAAGRAGRGEERGRVIIQTREVDHPTIVATVTGRFAAFARYELDYRKQLSYPPFGKLLRFVVSSPEQQDATNGAFDLTNVLHTLAKTLRERLDKPEEKLELSILGPTPAPYLKINSRYRWHIIVKSNNAQAISQLASYVYSWRTTLKHYKNLRIAVDVDPIDML
ncbi:MAG: primosomal protein N' [Proteobacteria bacterium]|nr:primosomal protein N' [Pseudomonadota bacterium]